MHNCCWSCNYYQNSEADGIAKPFDVTVLVLSSPDGISDEVNQVSEQRTARVSPTCVHGVEVGLQNQIEHLPTRGFVGFVGGSAMLCTAGIVHANEPRQR